MINIDYMLKGIKKEDQDKLTDAVWAALKVYDAGEKRITIRTNNRLKTTAGRAYPAARIIELNVKHYEKFGVQDLIETTMHELAHIIQYRRHGYTGHDACFKDLCVEMGGTMNATMAGKQWAAGATDNFIRSEYKHFYNCPCGTGWAKRVRPMTLKRQRRGCCKDCGTPITGWTHTIKNN